MNPVRSLCPVRNFRFKINTEIYYAVKFLTGLGNNGYNQSSKSVRNWFLYHIRQTSNGVKILAIETSCDDTCIAILEARGEKQAKFKILTNIVSSQVKLHAKYGGVYPFLAKREHQRNLPVVLKKALKEAGFANSKYPLFPHSQIPKIDLIAVTVGPGLEPCLWTGVNFARELARKWNLPLLPVNHIEAHILANFIGANLKYNPPPKFWWGAKIFPAVCLVVSGGHTQLILMNDFRKYKILGETRDDAAGECFDKAAKILGLGYPGGPAIAAEAAKFSSFNSQFSIKLPRPMIYQKNYDFSFSGLKTAVLYSYRSQPEKIKKSPKYLRAMAAEVQQAIVDVLIHKTLKAAKDFGVKTIILGGGVAANEELKKQFKEKIKKEIPNSIFYIPDSKLCTDNAAMIAAAAYFHWPQNKVPLEKAGDRPPSLAAFGQLEANADLRV